MIRTLFAATLFWAAAAPAAAVEPIPITLAEALALAAERNPELLATREAAAAEAERAESTRRLSWPRLALRSGWSRTDNPSLVFAEKLNSGQFTEDDFAIGRLNAPEPLSHLSTVLALEVPVDLFGKVRAGAEAERALERAASAEATAALTEVQMQVVLAYRQAALARRAVAVTERALQSARAREREIDAQVAEGVVLGANALRARARRREREADLAERSADADIAALGLWRLLGAAPGERYEALEATPDPEPLARDAQFWLERALQQRASLRGARERSEAAAAARLSREREWLPNLGAFAQLQDDRNTFGSNRTWTVGVGLRWSVLDLGRGRRQAAALADERAARLMARGAEDQVRLEVEQSWRRAQAARERHAAAAGGAEEGREALRVVQERRRAGMATLTDELETEAASLAAELREIEAAAGVAIADARLWRAAGVAEAAIFAGEARP